MEESIANLLPPKVSSAIGRATGVNKLHNPTTPIRRSTPDAARYQASR